MSLYKISTFLFLLTASTLCGQTNNAAIKMQTLDKKTKAPILDSLFVTIENTSTTKYRLMPDNEGGLWIKQLEPGRYDVSVSAKGYWTLKIKGVIVGEAKTAYLFMNLDSEEDMKAKKSKRRRK
jgi:Carboxypeptidase regulatory-like domain